LAFASPAKAVRNVIAREARSGNGTAQAGEAATFTDAGKITRIAVAGARNASVRATYLVLKDVRAAHSAVVPQLRA
jgi:hypothetical protein